VPSARLVPETGLAGKGWNAKPTVLLRRLDEGADEVLWLDADLLVTADVRPLFAGLGSDTLVVTEEVYWGELQGGLDRTLAWGLEPGTPLPRAVNTAVVRVTPHHVPLLRAWKALLDHPAYLDVQRRPFLERPLHMNSDQEVLTALLGSRPFQGAETKMLRRGVDIAQCFGPSGFTPAERMRGMGRGLPPFVHSMGSKPWDRTDVPSARWRGLANRLRRYYEQAHLELSPYTAVAREYRPTVGEPMAWTDPSTAISRVCAAVFRHDARLQELPLALVDAGFRHARRARGHLDHPITSRVNAGHG
jgi:hypothetical protein